MRISSRSCCTWALTVITLATVLRPTSAFTSTQRAFRVATPSLPLQALVADTSLTGPLRYRNRHEEQHEVVAEPKFLPTTASSSQPSELKPTSSGANRPLIRALLHSQGILFTITSLIALVVTGANFSSLAWSGADAGGLFSFSLTAVAQGVLATLPVIAASTTLERSSRRDASHLSFSTTNLVLTLFGRRHNDYEACSTQGGGNCQTTSTRTVMGYSGLLAMTTAFTEEMIYRLYLPALVFSVTHSVTVACLAQAFIFGLAHIHPPSTFPENGDKFASARLQFGLQTFIGAWYGLVFCVTGGNLVPAIVSHMLYDLHILVGHWHVINHQMDWTEEAIHRPATVYDQRQLQKLQEAVPLTTETLQLTRRFFHAFDDDHVHSLSFANVQRAVAYACLTDRVVPTPEEVKAVFLEQLVNRPADYKGPEDRLRLAEFLRLLFTLRSRSYKRERAAASAKAHH